MKVLPLTILLFAALRISSVAADPVRNSTRGTASADANGWPGAITLESKDAPSKAILVPGVGGRVVFYGVRGDNVLWLNPDAAGKKFETGGVEFEPGGFYCDLGPESALFPPHPGLTIGPWDFSIKKNFRVTLKSPEDKALGVELERDVVFDPRSGELGFIHKIENRKERDAAHTFWHRIACRPGGFVLTPLNKKSRFPAGWAVGTHFGGRPGFDANKPEVAGVRVLDGVLVAKTGSGTAKIGVDGDAQWVAYATGRTLFLIHYPVYSSATYSYGGNSVVIGWDERRTELQPLSAEARVRPRKTADFPLKWSLIELSTPVSTHEEARALVEKIPSSPFQ